MEENIQKGEVILYQPNETVRLEVRLENETVWLTQQQMVLLFESSKGNISDHLKNIFEQKELDYNSTVRKIRTVQKERKRNVVAKTTIRRSDIDEAWTFYQILCKKFAFMETLLFLCTNNHKQIS